MSLLSKEYRPIVAASVLGLLCTGGSGFFYWTAHQERMEAEKELKAKGEELNRLKAAGAPPTEDHLKQLQRQLETSESSVKKLRSSLEAMDFPLEKIQPQDFQTAMISKSKEIIAKAQKFRIPIPTGARESEPFSLDFDEFIKKLPAEDKVPLVNRQLIAAERLINTLLESKPLAIRSFKIDRQEEGKPEPKPEKPDPKGAPPRSSPILSVQGFDLWFAATPDSLRDFLNTLAREKSGLFVPRRIKVTTVSRDANIKEARDIRDIRPMDAPRKGEVPQAADQAASIPGQRKQEPVAQYILGDEHVEVEMRVDLLSTLPPAMEAAGKVSKDKGKEGQKKP